MATVIGANDRWSRRAARILPMLVFLLAACGSAETGQSTTTSSSETTTPPTTSTSTTVTTIPETTTSLAPTTSTTEAPEDERVTSGAFAVPFAFSADGAPSFLMHTFQDQLRALESGGKFLMFASPGSTVGGWAERLGEQGVSMSEPSVAMVAGEEVPIVEGVAEGTTAALFAYRDQSSGSSLAFDLESGDAVRIYLVEGDRTVTIFVVAPEAEFSDWVAETDRILTTLEWVESAG